MALFALWGLLAFPALPAPKWIRLSRGPVEILTDQDEGRARRLLERFDQLRLAFPRVVGRVADVRTPIRVLYFRSDAEYSLFRPNEQTPAFYQGGPERDTVVMGPATEGDQRVILHEFSHALLNHSLTKLPLWLDEGLAEVFSTIAPRRDGVEVGREVPSHQEMLKRSEWIPAEELLKADKSSRFYRLPGATQLFYAEGWALTHMLLLEPSYREHWGEFLQGLAQGRAVNLAFREAFGRSFTQAVADARTYIQQRALPRQDVTAGERLSGPAAVLKPLDPDAQEQATLDMLVRTGRTAVAIERVSGLSRRSPDDPQWIEWRARLARFTREAGDPASLFEKAIATGRAAPETYFEYAALQRDRKAPPERVRQLLNEAVRRNPQYAEAHFLLGLLAGDAGDNAEAVRHLEHATEILPRQFPFWQSLANAYHDAGQYTDELRAAQQSANAAGSNTEREIAAALLQRASAPPAAVPVRRPAVIERQTEPLRRQDGQLRRVDCLGQEARLHIEHDGRSVRLRMSREASLTWRGAKDPVLPCGTGLALPVSAEFRPVPNPELGTEGDVSRLTVQSSVSP